MEASRATKPILPDRIRRKLREGESIYFSAAAVHRSATNPHGKWRVQVRRMENGSYQVYPVRAFPTPEPALAYVVSTRPEARKTGLAPNTAPKGDLTVRELYEFCREHTWKKIGSRRIVEKERRWRLHIEPYWGTWSLSKVRRTSAQQWLTEAENGFDGTEGLSSADSISTDILKQLFSTDSMNSRTRSLT